LLDENYVLEGLIYPETVQVAAHWRASRPAASGALASKSTGLAMANVAMEMTVAMMVEARILVAELGLWWKVGFERVS
jgi:hypothetical protein